MVKDKDFVSCKEVYRVGDIVKYEYFTNGFNTARILELSPKSVKIKIGIPEKKNKIYEDILSDVPYSKIMPIEIYEKYYKK